MSQLINVNGQSINYPETGDTNWGDEATDFAIQTSAAFGKLGLASGTSVDIAQTLDVTGNTTLDANLSVAGTTSLTGNVTLTNNLTVNGNTLLGNANTDTTTVTGIVNIDSGVLYVDPVNNRVGINDTTPSEALDVTGNALISGTLGVTGDVAINTNKFNIIASSGNTTIAGTLGISNGTASAPSLTPSGDTNTGLYSIGADKIGFSANGVRQGEFGVGYGGFTGNVIQCVESLLTSTYSITTAVNNVLITTGIVGQITTKLNNSNILILINQQGTYQGLANYIYSIIYRNTSSWLGNVSPVGTSLNRKHVLGATANGTLNPIIQLDSPGVSAGTTLYYGNSVSNNGTGSTVTINYDPAGFSASRAFASIVLMEIAT